MCPHEARRRRRFARGCPRSVRMTWWPAHGRCHQSIDEPRESPITTAPTTSARAEPTPTKRSRWECRRARLRAARLATFQANQPTTAFRRLRILLIENECSPRRAGVNRSVGRRDVREVRRGTSSGSECGSEWQDPCDGRPLRTARGHRHPRSPRRSSSSRVSRRSRFGSRARRGRRSTVPL